MRRQQIPDPITIPEIDESRSSASRSRSQLRPPPTATSYIRAIQPLQDSRSPYPLQDRHPADVPLSVETIEEETQQARREPSSRRPRQHHRRRRRRKHHGHRPNQWVRRKRDRSLWKCIIRSKPARSKLYACALSGIIIAAVLAVYLTLALTREVLRHEIHVLFIMVVVGLTLFFCHSLIRLFMLATLPQEKTPVIPTIGTTENFRPVEPIRVHVVHDVELGIEHNGNDDWDDEDLHDDRDLEKKLASPVAPPPPVYGQWRGSVRADPNLLHWARVESLPAPVQARAINHHTPSLKALESRSMGTASSSINDSETAVAQPLSRSNSSSSSSAGRPQQALGARPPSYISEDGVSYVVDGVPRSTAGVSDIHPAWRSPGMAPSPKYVTKPQYVREPQYAEAPAVASDVASPSYAPSAVTEWPCPTRI